MFSLCKTERLNDLPKLTQLDCDKGRLQAQAYPTREPGPFQPPHTVYPMCVVSEKTQGWDSETQLCVALHKMSLLWALVSSSAK